MGAVIMRFPRLILAVIDDLLLLAGCICILYGLSLWNVVVTWIVAGLMLIVIAVLIGRARGRHVTN